MKHYRIRFGGRFSRWRLSAFRAVLPPGASEQEKSLTISLSAALAGIVLIFPAADFFASKVGTLFPVFNVSRQTLWMAFAGAACVGVVCRATVDGAVWIGHLKPADDKPIKLPATYVLRDLLPPSVPEIPIDYTKPGRQLPVQDAWFNVDGNIAYLHFSFHNGGMSTAQCRVMLDVYKQIAKLPVKGTC